MPSWNATLLFATAVAAVALAACGAGSDSTDAAIDTPITAAEPSTDDENHDDVEDTDDHEDEHEDENEADSGGLSAHEHGSAELLVAWGGGEMVIDLITPTHNIFGFEYEPTSDEDLAVVADRTEALSEPTVMLVNSEAECELSGDVITETEFEGSHAELTASWLYVCNNPTEINQLDAAELFARFPDLQDVDAQWASESGQSSAELSPSAATLDLE